jgi:leucyl aminopeptidase
MQIQIAQNQAFDSEVDFLVIANFEDQNTTDFQTADTHLQGALLQKVNKLKFKSKAKDTLCIDTLGKIKAQTILVLGLGKSSQYQDLVLRDVCAVAIREAYKQKANHVGFLFPSLPQNATRELSTGVLLGLYKFDQFMSKDAENPKHEITHISFFENGFQIDQALIHQGQIIADSVNIARELVNEPANVCTPTRLAQLSQSFEAQPNVQVTVWGRDKIVAEGMGGLIAVSQGATQEPKFIHIAYTPKNSRGRLVFVGKGLTFDSGGLSIKPAKGMEEMFIDMGGAAAVIGAMRAITHLQLDIEVHGLVGACENMPDGNSYRPSDILTMYNGKTVEVLNTDAEGRLVLADVLHYGTKLNPDGMVDLATLTGACMVALGTNYCGLFSDQDAWADTVLKASKEAGEKAWRLPLDEELGSTIKSKRADITNLGGPWGGAITAALFLKHFKGDTNWCHLDIAGPTHVSKENGYICDGGTGFGVLTLIKLAETFSKSSSLT